ncbi:MAG: hypothetical protein RL011_1799, partial [Pseudomonadota bacterium]
MRLSSLASIVIALLLVYPRVTLAQSDSDPETDLFGTSGTVEESVKPKKPAKTKRKAKKEKLPEAEPADPFASTVEDAPKAEVLDSALAPESTDAMSKTDGLEKTDGAEKTEGVEKTDGLDKTEPQESLDGEKRKA